MASSSRGQDSYLDDEEEDTCPLCVEEFDIDDKNFKPCPCGYQVCQFCFNNIRNNMNGLCPACRRPYDEATIEYKKVTPEEAALFKANAQKKDKRKAVERQKEAQKREVEHLNRKHLAGLRVIQRNLVYVMGLNPGAAQGQDMLEMLKGDKYFGQYGKILKIAVAKAKNGEPPISIASQGVYVTFARKEDAARCIAAVNGSQNGDRVLRAQLGTTKYCSAYLRNETCTNKNCMFLHEPGDNDDSYSRQDLSTFNSVSTQRPLPVTTPSMTAKVAAQAPMQQPMAVAAPSMVREASKEGAEQRDSSALPSSASWANRGLQGTSRRGSTTDSGAAASPVVVSAEPEPASPDQEQTEWEDIVGAESEPAPEPEVERDSEHEAESHQEEEHSIPKRAKSARSRLDSAILELFNAINSPDLDDWFVDPNLKGYPQLIDKYGGWRQRLAHDREALEVARLREEQARLLDQDTAVDTTSEIHTISEPQDDDATESGSLQLGGEPEDREYALPQAQNLHDQRHPGSQMPISRTSNDNGSFGNPAGFQSPSRNMTPQQQQQHMLGLFKSAPASNSFADQYPPGMSERQSSLLRQQPHSRQPSKYGFTATNENASVTSSSSSKQAIMLPPQSSTFYGSSVQGPPPGLKSTGTPPMNGMYGPAPGFGGGVAGTSSFNNGRDDLLRDMMRGRELRELTGDTNKREYTTSSFINQYPPAFTRNPPSGVLGSSYGESAAATSQVLSQQDPSHKKKKGKKHRHANTSSSGGSVLVNLVDPNSLGRMPHQQQQSAAEIGSGLFGGQAQGGYNQNMFGTGSGAGTGYPRW